MSWEILQTKIDQLILQMNGADSQQSELSQDQLAKVFENAFSLIEQFEQQLTKSTGLKNFAFNLDLANELASFDIGVFTQVNEDFNVLSSASHYQKSVKKLAVFFKSLALKKCILESSGDELKIMFRFDNLKNISAKYKSILVSCLDSIHLKHKILVNPESSMYNVSISINRK